MANKTLNAAKAAKNDEFYTQLSDIENELRHYKSTSVGRRCFAIVMTPEYLTSLSTSRLTLSI